MLKKFLTLSLAALALASCGDSNTDAASGTTKENKDMTIAVIPKGTSHSFWKTVQAGAMKAAKEEGVNVIWKGPAVENDNNAQAEVVKNFITQKVDAIAIAPCNSAALKGPVESAIAAGIKTLLFDSGLDSDKIECEVTTDNYAAGKMAADFVAKQLDGKGKIIMLRYLAGSQSTHEREEGFKDGIKAHKGISFLSSEEYGGTAISKNKEKLTTILATLNINEVSAIYGSNQATLKGALAALEDKNLTGKIKLYGFDSDEQLIAALQDGKVHGIVQQDPYNMGYLAVKNAVKMIKGEKVKAMEDTGAKLITKDNLQSPEIKALINPDLSGLE